MAGGVALRIIDTFFRRWWIYLIPTVLLVALGVYTTVASPDDYESTALLRASQGSLLSDITEIGDEQPTFTDESPATITGRQISELLRTDDFVDRIATAAELDADADDVGDRNDIRIEIRDAVAIRAEGENLVFVEATTADPESSRVLAQATIDNFLQYVIDANGTESDTAERFLSDLLGRYDGEFQAAATDIDNYLIANPEPLDPEQARPTAEQIQIDRLTSTAGSAQERYTRVLRQLEEVQLGREQTVADTRQRLNVVDTPVAPVAPQSGLVSVVLNIGLFTTIGVLLSGVAVVLVALLDRSLRFPSEVRSTLHADVLGIVPAESERRLSKVRKQATAPVLGTDVADKVDA